MAQTKTSKARERILDTADHLFYREGVQAVGIDRIIADSDVAKTTLYKHFRSKEELVSACLTRRDEAIRAWIDDYLAAQDSNPVQQILAVFDFLDHWFRTDEFRGCAFTNASLEMHGTSLLIQAAVTAHKTALLTLFRDNSEASGAKDSVVLSEQLMILYEGAIISALVRQKIDAAKHAKSAAISLLAKATSP